MAKLQAVFASAVLLYASAATADVPFTTHTAQYKNLPQEFFFDAVVEAVNRSTVSAETTGRVTEINFDIGDQVRAGSVLIRITEAEQQSRLAAVEASEIEAQARLQEAEDEYQRVEEVYEKKLVAKAAIDKARADLKAARQRLKAAAANVKQAKEQLRYTTVKAPYSGLVVDRHVELGEMVNPGKPVITGLSLQSLRVAAHIPQSYMQNLQSADKVGLIFPSLGDRIIETSDIRVSPQADAASHTFLVRAYLPKDTKDLFPGMFSKLVVNVGEKKSLLLPEQAVVRRSELTAVYVVNEQKIAFRQIRIGRRQGGMIEILAGVKEGEQVALDPIQAGIQLKQQRTNKTGD
ncbi:efflux RND transporter periplasmic adaptor subunit [Kaarinaea lacus]